VREIEIMEKIKHALGLLFNAALLKCRFVRQGVRIHPSTRVGRRAEICIFPAGQGSICIGEDCWIDDYVRIMTYGGSIEIGKHSSVNDFTVIRGTVRIGDHVRIAPHCVLVALSHKFDRTDIPISAQGSIKRPIVVEDDVWIGSNSTVLDGVTIHRGSVIGAGSVVTHDIQEFSVAVGNPARVIRKRAQSTECNK